MTCWRRKYRELNTGQKRLLFAFLALLVAVLFAVLVLFLIPGQFKVKRILVLDKGPGIIYFNLNSVEQMSTFMPWIDTEAIIDDLPKEGKYNKFRLFRFKNGDVLRVRKSKEDPVRNVSYEIYVNNDYVVDMDWYLSLADSVNTRLEIVINASIPFFKRWRYMQIYHEINRKLDTALTHFQHKINKASENYRLNVLQDTLLARQKYMGIGGTVHRLDYAKKMDKDLPRVLIYGIRHDLLKPGTKPVILFLNRTKDSIQYIVGIQIKDSVESEIPKPFKLFYMPGMLYKKFEVTGDYVYSSLARRDAIQYLKASNNKLLTGQPYFIEMIVGHTRYPDDPSKWKIYLYLPIVEQSTGNE